jgi:excinuclease ABC subunit A
VDRIDHLPPALALRQRPPIPGPRSTVGTMSEVLNVLRLMMSRLGSHLCPNSIGPSIATQGMEIVCPVCGARIEDPSAESFSVRGQFSRAVDPAAPQSVKGIETTP